MKSIYCKDLYVKYVRQTISEINVHLELKHEQTMKNVLLVIIACELFISSYLLN